jgi:hypothetical protein
VHASWLWVGDLQPSSLRLLPHLVRHLPHPFIIIPGLFLHYSALKSFIFRGRQCGKAGLSKKTRTEEHRRKKSDLKWMTSQPFRGQPMHRSCSPSTNVIKYCMFVDLKLQPRVATIVVAWLQCKRCKPCGRIMRRTWASTGPSRMRGPVPTPCSSLPHQS